MTAILRSWTLAGLDKLGIVNITEVQRQTLEGAKEHVDCLVQSRAGTGKTTAMGILISETHKPSSSSLIIVPNETLATQIEDILKLILSDTLCICRQLKSVLEEGKSVNSGLERHHHLVMIAEMKTLSQNPDALSSFRPSLILFDEADELFNDAYHVLSARLLKSCLRTAKTLFFSATFPPYIVTRIEEALSFADPDRESTPYHIKLCVSTSVDASVNAVVPHVHKHYTLVRDSGLIQASVHLITTKTSRSRTVVFGGSKKITESIFEELRKSNIPACIMKSPLDDFSEARVTLDPQGFLSRGVNIPGLDCGISIGVPEEKETLLHQWGRIAREGQEGDFYHIVTPEELDQISFLSFQLGVEFDEYSLDLGTSKHPFEIHTSTEERMEHVIHLIEQFS